MFVRADRLSRTCGPARSTRAATRCSRRSPSLRRAFGDPSVDRRAARRLHARRRAGAEVDALRGVARRRHRRRLLDAGDDRGAAELSASALELLPRRSAAVAPGDWAAPHRARLDEARVRARRRRELVGAACGSEARRPDRRAGGRGGDVPLPGRSVGAADHRAVPRGPPGRCVGGLPAGPHPARGRARARSRAPAAGARATDPRPRPGARHRRSRGASARSHARAGNLPSLSAELVGRETEIAAVSDLLASQRLVEIVGPGGIGKTAVAIATGRRLPSRTVPRPVGSGWPGWKPRRRRTTSSTR